MNLFKSRSLVSIIIIFSFLFVLPNNTFAQETCVINPEIIRVTPDGQSYDQSIIKIYKQSGNLQPSSRDLMLVNIYEGEESVKTIVLGNVKGSEAEPLTIDLTKNLSSWERNNIIIGGKRYSLKVSTTSSPGAVLCESQLTIDYYGLPPTATPPPPSEDYKITCPGGAVVQVSKPHGNPGFPLGIEDDVTFSFPLENLGDGDYKMVYKSLAIRSGNFFWEILDPESQNDEYVSFEVPANHLYKRSRGEKLYRTTPFRLQKKEGGKFDDKPPYDK